ncbi:MAG: phosphoglycerate mutase [Burkholderiaceae bacterium]|nr:phosphoglycerate mutase [Burkholderiaceae bacterium]
MSDPLHLLVPYAVCRSEGGQHALQGLALPHLDGLLARLQPAAEASLSLDEDSPDMPHERALARALGLPETPGRTPWAAWQVQQQGQALGAEAWAFVTPCHWQVGTDHITLADPQALGLDEDASRALLDIVGPWFAEDGITLAYDQPTRWLAQGTLLAEVATPSLERVQGQDVRAWMQQAGRAPGLSPQAVRAAQTLQRLHSEMQMLLYTHPFNDARAAQGLAPVNAFWVHGAGRLPDAARAMALPVPTQPQTLRDAALRADWPGWARAWQALDAGPLAQMHAHVARGGSARLTLCGERSALSWHSAPRSLRQRIQGFLRPQRFTSLHNVL